MYYLCYILYAFEYYVTILYKYVTVHLYTLFTAGKRSRFREHYITLNIIKLNINFYMLFNIKNPS